MSGVAPGATVDPMAEIISQRELRNNSGEIMRRLDAGESFVVTRDGRPVGELIPLRRDRLVPMSEVKRIFEGSPRIDYEQLRRDLDAIADPSAEPRA